MIDHGDELDIKSHATLSMQHAKALPVQCIKLELHSLRSAVLAVIISHNVTCYTPTSPPLSAAAVNFAAAVMVGVQIAVPSNWECYGHGTPIYTNCEPPATCHTQCAVRHHSATQQVCCFLQTKHQQQ